MTDWQNRITGYKQVPANQLLANPDNARRHPPRQREALRGSLDALGIVDAVLVNARTGYLIDGHARVEEALTRNEAMPLPVLEVDLSEDEEKLFLASFDYITYMADYDRDALDSLLQQLQADDSAMQVVIEGDERLQAMLSEMAQANGLTFGDAPDVPGDAEAQLNRAEEWLEKFGVERGQVWVIGRHRLMCGDAYNEADLVLLLVGVDVDMLHTDPPYGINIVQPRKGLRAAAIGGAKPFGSTAPANRKGTAAIAERNSRRAERGHVQHGAPSRNQIIQSNLYPVIEGDDTPFNPAFLLDLAPIVILWGGNYFADKLPISSGWIVWDKREDITRNNFADCELAWSNQDKPARLFHHLWNGLHKGSQHGERRVHPTEKPVALFEEIGKMFCPTGVWLDLFAGSGAQIVAAERTGATCYALEYEPLYVATILQRLTDMGCTPAKAP